MRSVRLVSGVVASVLALCCACTGGSDGPFVDIPDDPNSPHDEGHDSDKVGAGGDGGQGDGAGAQGAGSESDPEVDMASHPASDGAEPSVEPETDDDVPLADGADAGGGAGTDAVEPDAAERDAGVGGADEELKLGEPILRLNGMPFRGAGDEQYSGGTGSIVRQGEEYYWFGVDSGHDVTVSRTSDLSHFSPAEVVFTAEGLTAQPQVVHDSATGQYFRFVNGSASIEVATSDSPVGPYLSTGEFTPPRFTDGFSVFAEDTGPAYLVATLNDDDRRLHDVEIRPLTDAALDMEAPVSTLSFDAAVDGPAQLFERDGVYYLLVKQYKNLRVATTTDLAGQWELSPVPLNWELNGPLGCVLQIPGGSEFVLVDRRAWWPLTFPEDVDLRLTWFNTVEVDLARGRVNSSNADVLLVNEQSGLVLDVADGSTEYRVPVALSAMDGAESQRWTLYSEGGSGFTVANVGSERPLSFAYTVEPLVYFAVQARRGTDLDRDETDGPYWQTFVFMHGPEEGTFQLYNSTLDVSLGATDQAQAGDAVALLDRDAPGALWRILPVQ